MGKIQPMGREFKNIKFIKFFDMVYLNNYNLTFYCWVEIFFRAHLTLFGT